MTLDTGISNIITRMKALGAVNKFEVYDTQVPTGYHKEFENQAPVPYVIMDFGDLARPEEAQQSVVGVLGDMHWTVVLFEAVSASPANTRQLKSIIRNSFTGWIPDEGWGEMVPRYSAAYTVNKPDGTEFWPARHASTLAYVVDIDSN